MKAPQNCREAWISRHLLLTGAALLGITLFSVSQSMAGSALYLNVDSNLVGGTAGTLAFADINPWVDPGSVSVAAGPNHVMEMTNQNVLIVNKQTGRVVASDSLWGWFGYYFMMVSGDVYSPHVIYDQYRGRWITIALTGLPDDAVPSSVLLIGVSHSSDPTQGWEFTSVDMAMDGYFASGNWCTFAQIGLDQNSIYVTANENTVSSSTVKVGTTSVTVFNPAYAYSKIRILPKNVLYTVPLPAVLGTSSYSDLTNISDMVSQSTGYGLQPCHSYGAAAAEYLVSAVPIAAASTSGKPGLASSGVVLWKLATGSGGPRLTSQFVHTAAFSDPPGVAQPNDGSSYSIPGLFGVSDSSLTSAVYRNGMVWTAGNTGAFLSNTLVSAIHWMRLNVSTATAADDQVLHGGPGESYYLPAITADKNSIPYISFNWSSPKTFAGLQVAAVLPQYGTLPIRSVVTGGQSSWPSSTLPFGQYGGIAVDPTDDATMWLAGEVANNIYGGYSDAETDTAVARARLSIAPYAATILNSSGMTDTWGSSILGGIAVGYGSGSVTSGQVHALRWPALGATLADLTPGLKGQSHAVGVYGAVDGGDSTVAGYQHGSLWTSQVNGKVTSVDLNPSGYLTSSVAGLSGVQQVGYGYLSGKDFRALLWSGTAKSVKDLTPTGFARAYAFAISGNQQVGVGIKSNGDVHPLLWTGSAVSYQDLLPLGYVGAYALALSGRSQAGYAWPVGKVSLPHAILWSGSVSGAVDLNPARISMSEALGINAGCEVGWVSGEVTAQAQHAAVWSGSAGTFFDLHQVLPPNYVSSWAAGVDSSGNIVGTAVDANGRHSAIVWSQQALH